MLVTSQEVDDVTVTSCWWRHKSLFVIIIENEQVWRSFCIVYKHFFSNSEVKGIGKELRPIWRLEVLAHKVGSWLMVKTGVSGVSLACKRRERGFGGKSCHLKNVSFVFSPFSFFSIETLIKNRQNWGWLEPEVESWKSKKKKKI